MFIPDVIIVISEFQTISEIIKSRRICRVFNTTLTDKFIKSSLGITDIIQAFKFSEGEFKLNGFHAYLSSTNHIICCADTKNGNFYIVYDRYGTKISHKLIDEHMEDFMFGILPTVHLSTSRVLSNDIQLVMPGIEHEYLRFINDKLIVTILTFDNQNLYTVYKKMKNLTKEVHQTDIVPCAICGNFLIFEKIESSSRKILFYDCEKIKSFEETLTNDTTTVKVGTDRIVAFVDKKSTDFYDLKYQRFILHVDAACGFVEMPDGIITYYSTRYCKVISKTSFDTFIMWKTVSDRLSDIFRFDNNRIIILGESTRGDTMYIVKDNIKNIRKCLAII